MVHTLIQNLHVLVIGLFYTWFAVCANDNIAISLDTGEVVICVKGIKIKRMVSEKTNY